VRIEMIPIFAIFLIIKAPRTATGRMASQSVLWTWQRKQGESCKMNSAKYELARIRIEATETRRKGLTTGAPTSFRGMECACVIRLAPLLPQLPESRRWEERDQDVHSGKADSNPSPP